MIKRLVSVLAVLVMVTGTTALAEVITVDKTDGHSGYKYVAGSHNSYPIEYYDKDAECFKGIIPDMLEVISERSGVDFVYINGNGDDKAKLYDNLQAEIISSVKRSEVKDGDLYRELFSYSQSGKTEGFGICFTALTDEATVNAILTAADKITIAEQNGICVNYANEGTATSIVWIIISALLAIMTVILTAVLLKRMRRIKEESLIEKMTDEETGMGNLSFFKHHFRYTISDVARTLYYVAYIILDSSYLRSYHGESSFDEVLRYSASVLAEHEADREIAARITENGFAFAFQAHNDKEAEQRLCEVMNRLNSFGDMREKNNKLVFHAAVYKLTQSDKNCEILLFNLRKNCNRIFGTDKQIVFCDSHSMNRVQEEKKMTESILKGFENGEFKMYLQFVVDNKTKRVVSAEALSRWDSPSKGLIAPNRYIQTMEVAGLISRHDFYMFEHACRQLEKWRGTEFDGITISCNFTRITLSEENFIERLSMIANAYEFDRSSISIEITEDSIEKDREIATKNVMRCKELGFKIYLDDLGSGYTSLANLCDYPIDVVKIDRDILLMADTQNGRALFKGIIALAHSLKIKVICEGVETEEQNDFVSSLDCDYIQGWYYSKVLPIEECPSFIERYYSRF